MRLSTLPKVTGSDSEFKSRRLAFVYALNLLNTWPSDHTIWCEHITWSQTKTLPREWCYEYHLELSKVITRIYYSHYFTVGLASLKFFVLLMKSSQLLSFMYLPQVCYLMKCHFLLEGPVLPPFGYAGASFPFISWKRCATASYSWLSHLRE